MILKELYYRLTKQRFIPINNIFYQGKRIHFDRIYKSHCILNNGSGITYLNKEQEETITHMLEEDKNNGNGIEKIIRAENIIRRCCVCKRTEKLPEQAQPYFSDGILSFECFRNLYTGQFPESEIKEILSSSNGNKVYQNCNELYGPFYAKEEATNGKRTASISGI